MTEEVNYNTLENLLLEMQQKIMNKSDDEYDDEGEEYFGDEGIEEAIKTIRAHFGMKDYPFTGKSWYDKPSTEILDRVMNETDLSGVFR
jgi:hypothetical protein